MKTKPNYDHLPLFADPRYDLYTTIRSHTPERRRAYKEASRHA